MLVSLVINGLTLFFRGLMNGFQRKASTKSLICCSCVLAALGILFILVGLSPDHSYLPVGIILILADIILILLNTVFKDKSSQETE